MSICPKCHRPFNEGNSPNAEECNGTDDDDGLCEAYTKIHAAEQRVERARQAVIILRAAIEACRDERPSQKWQLDKLDAVLAETADAARAGRE
jgi:hypothetical protein